MTKEETKEMWDSIEKLSELRSNYSCFDKEEEPYYHALSLGIKGIKSLEQPTSDDCVSRAEILQMIEDIQNAGGFIGYNTYSEAFDQVDNMPPVTPTRKIGKWVYDKASQNWRCSVCNETPKTLGYVGTSDFMEKEFVFCNHCGAEMVGAENE